MERILHDLFTFSGRINRITWLAFFLALAAAESLSGALLRDMLGIDAPAAGGTSLEDYFNDRAGFVAGLIFLWPALAVDVKRWHDIGRSGWLALIAYGPVFAMYLLEELKNAGFIPATPLPGPLLSMMGLAFLVYIILLGARKGPAAANRFGPASLEPRRPL
jgi:uncharacterized membrane protein YhaH (DUF805 family)